MHSTRAGLVSMVVLSICGCSGGSPWREVKAFEDLYSLSDLWVFGPDDVWVVGGRIRHFDGADWSEPATGSSAGYVGIWGFAPDDLWFVGGSALMHWDGSRFENTDLTAHGMQDATAIWGLPPDQLWIAGDGATILHRDGASWSRSNSPCSSNTAIFGFSPSDIWTQGTFGTCRFNGSAWEEVEVGLFGGGGDVFGLAPDDVWVVSESAEAAHWDGKSFRVYENESFVGEMVSLWGAASDDIWGVGVPGSVAHFDGARWKEVTHQTIGSPYLRMFNAVHGSSAKDVWAVGSEMGANRNCALVFRYQPD